MPLSSLIGHEQAVTLLRRAVTGGRVPQSLLLAGPDGVGKRTAAIGLAQALNCPHPTRPSGDGCGTCPACVRIAGGRHADVVLVDRGEDASIKIDVLRDRVLDTIGYRPFESRRRVYVIDEAERLTAQSQDALLKTLEEPPPAAVLILVSAMPDALHATVRSRCRRLRFGALSEAHVERVLRERLQVDAARARTLAAISGGSLSQALAADTGDLEDDRRAALDLLTAARGASEAVRLKAAVRFATVDRKRRAREALGVRLDLVAALLRDLAVLGTGSPRALAHADLAAPLRGLVPAFGPVRLSAGFSAVTRGQALLDRYASPKLVADWVALAL